MLYPLSGLAAWLVWRRIDIGVERKRAALRLWGWQLMLSALWAASLFGVESPALALLATLCLLVALAQTVLAFFRLQPAAGMLLTPYAVWLVLRGGVVVGAVLTYY